MPSRPAAAFAREAVRHSVRRQASDANQRDRRITRELPHVRLDDDVELLNAKGVAEERRIVEERRSRRLRVRPLEGRLAGGDDDAPLADVDAEDVDGSIASRAPHERSAGAVE